MELKEELGETICDRCDGTGVVYTSKSIRYIRNSESKHVKVCPKCLGEKKLDWVEVVTGKKTLEVEIWYAPAGFTKNRRMYKPDGLKKAFENGFMGDDIKWKNSTKK